MNPRWTTWWANAYTTGMSVRGFEDQNPSNPHCCHDLSIFEKPAVSPEEVAQLRVVLREKKITHRTSAVHLGISVSALRERLYGRKIMTGAMYSALLDLSSRRTHP